MIASTLMNLIKEHSRKEHRRIESLLLSGNKRYINSIQSSALLLANTLASPTDGSRDRFLFLSTFNKSKGQLSLIFGLREEQIFTSFLTPVFLDSNAIATIEETVLKNEINAIVFLYKHSGPSTGEALKAVRMQLLLNSHAIRRRVHFFRNVVVLAHLDAGGLAGILTTPELPPPNVTKLELVQNY